MDTEVNKTILIIGSSGGLGRVLVNYFKDKPFNLALHYYKNAPEIKKSTIKTYQADITNEDEVIELINRVQNDFEKIDLLLHNAGVSINGMSWKIPLEDWNQTLAVNLTGPFLVSKHVIPIMREYNFGRILFMSSIVAQTGFIGTAAYAASKAGLIGLTKTLSKELANKNITVNAIALGYFNAGMINDVPEDMQTKLITSIPVGELGDPLQLASLIEFLCAEQSAYLTGQTLNLNGGLYS